MQAPEASISQNSNQTEKTDDIKSVLRGHLILARAGIEEKRAGVDKYSGVNGERAKIMLSFYMKFLRQRQLEAYVLEDLIANPKADHNISAIKNLLVVENYHDIDEGEKRWIFHTTLGVINGIMSTHSLEVGRQRGLEEMATTLVNMQRSEMSGVWNPKTLDSEIDKKNPETSGAYAVNAIRENGESARRRRITLFLDAQPN